MVSGGSLQNKEKGGVSGKHKFGMLCPSLNGISSSNESIYGSQSI